MAFLQSPSQDVPGDGLGTPREDPMEVPRRDAQSRGDGVRCQLRIAQMFFYVGADAHAVLDRPRGPLRSGRRYCGVGTGDHLQGDLRESWRELRWQLLLDSAPEIAEVACEQCAGAGLTGHHDGASGFRAGDITCE